MNTKFSIKNFRVFDENGVDIELAPITILTGKNSAGKILSHPRYQAKFSVYRSFKQVTPWKC